MTAAILASEGGSLGFPILPALVFVPMFGALLIALIPRSRPEVARQVAILASLVTGVLSIVLLVKFDTADDGFQFVARRAGRGAPQARRPGESNVTNLTDTVLVYLPTGRRED